MGHKFADIAFTGNVKKTQEQNGSRSSCARMEGGEPHNHILSGREAAFIAARDSFYMATVSETGWPYIQHRGGPPGFIRVLDETTIGFADFSGNRQYVSVGNLATEDRVSLILVDYRIRARLKILGRAKIVAPENTDVLQRLQLPDYHRMDVAVTYHWTSGRGAPNSLGLSFFNIYNHQNVWYKDYQIVGGQLIETNVYYLGFTPNLILSWKLK